MKEVVGCPPFNRVAGETGLGNKAAQVMPPCKSRCRAMEQMMHLGIPGAIIAKSKYGWLVETMD